MKQSDVVLFMKGDRDTPRWVVSKLDTVKFSNVIELTLDVSFSTTRRCGFSQKIVGILNSEEIEYTTFDILGDEGVRQSKSIPSLVEISHSSQN